MKSPELLTETAKLDMDISPLPSVQSQAISDAIVNAPQKIVDRAKAIMNGG